MSRTTNNTTVKVSGVIKAQTRKAILILASKVNNTLVFPDDPNKTKSVWFPLSQVMQIMRGKPDSGELDYVNVKEWIVLKTPEFKSALKDVDQRSSANPTLPQRGTNGGRMREDDEGYGSNYPGEYEDE